MYSRLMTQTSTASQYQYRLRAYNRNGDPLRLWADIDTDLIENLSVSEAFQIIEAGHKSGWRSDHDREQVKRNRIAYFRLIHPNGHAEIFTR